MDIVIVGAGKVGQTLCEELSQIHNVVMIDLSSNLVDELMNKYDITGMVGNGASIDTQKEAGVEHADIFIAATDSDEVNLISATLAKKLGVRHTVSRVRNPEYAKQLDFMRNALGISLIINPEMAAAMDIARAIRYASASNVETLAGNRASLVEVDITDKSTLNGLSLSDFRTKYGSVLVCIIDRDGDVFIPSGSDTLQANDKIYVAGLPKDMTTFHRQIGNSEKAIKSVFVLGGGKIAYYLFKLLEHTHMDMKVIEHNLEKCEQLSAEYPALKVIHADGTNPDILDEQGLENYDAFVSLTGVDEENLIASIYADKKGVRKVITKMSRTNILKVLDTKQLKKIVTPKNLIASQISRFVRSRANAQGSRVEALYRVAQGKVEVLMFKVSEQCHILDRQIKDMPLKKNLLIAYILRQGKIIYANGRDSLQADDKVIVITTNKHFSDLEDILDK
ncbi:Trk system potassium transporter TrkA [Carnobacteriaceae bacterium zg-84]|uniref:Trk system potassium transporter TrkA n=1 Tax=Granulicatella sp. zg-84 TaxID=2678503 RepID=UPI0013C1A24F|nr:Trk system potassium transporter TrkA [Granulicatella sp. zg-84]NEW66919.1 Trk system potassium transporter TrkA [Granulicatella sp. zg-84]QMI86236.1 Trk system potassium transporter TrkA [Carnobacteriaceae bacterium zg-84]